MSKKRLPEPQKVPFQQCPGCERVRLGTRHHSIYENWGKPNRGFSVANTIIPTQCGRCRDLGNKAMEQTMSLVDRIRRQQEQ